MTVSIRKILIANRGEIARRIERTCRAMGIATVAVCSDPDRDAAFVAEADEVVALGGQRPAESYLRADAIIDAAKKTGSDAIHPGYGCLSENAGFASACQQAGITFIGPPAEVIAAMGSKIEAKRRMQQAGVPLLPTIEVGQQSAEQLLRRVEGLSWPLLVKASAGGGGRGMRIVRRPSELAALVETARNEADAAFGDGSLFIEPYIERARHVEIQIFGDTHGNVVHLFERDCSIQRRHQKIIEESPAPGLDDELRHGITTAAVRAAQAIGYVNAGTVEFLLTPDGKYYFLEVNTRLQVEHPVTELVTGLDLVRLQILVARGQPLPREVFAASPHGHAIEARLCVEDPRHDYRPSAGSLHRFQIPRGPGIRVDTAVDDAAIISPYYDSLLAKVIAHAPTRAEAAALLSRTLARARIHGLRTNRELLVRTLDDPEFRVGEVDTHFLERHDPIVLGTPLADAAAAGLHAAAAALAAQAERRAEAKVLRRAPSGWRNNPSQSQHVQFRDQDDVNQRLIDVEYHWRRDGLMLRIDGRDQVLGRSPVATPSQVNLEVDGIARSFAVHRVGETFFVDSPLGASVLVEVPRFPSAEVEVAAGSLVAPLPGVVNEVRVRPGDVVAAGDVVLVIDSMKMFHWISAPAAGRVVEIRVEAGSQVESGTLLAVIEEPA